MKCIDVERDQYGLAHLGSGEKTVRLIAVRPADDPRDAVRHDVLDHAPVQGECHLLQLGRSDADGAIDDQVVPVRNGEDDADDICRSELQHAFDQDLERTPFFICEHVPVGLGEGS